ncbi:hypothetical protein Rmet_6526 [Cupriavidus metallidurans CH34]|uniref:Uncharacterized protein n=1 Tax=Cupriavidus metallidurans (strain ATCC 43123 / DSM 2839 / NBRC 102507 / CH34) TaxID=266264 RepID=D3DXW3_CUPMC|nr:hypothetical protein Rmet_6526 [Cupriavidus metallidurans CH34]
MQLNARLYVEKPEAVKVYKQYAAHHSFCLSALC